MDAGIILMTVMFGVGAVGMTNSESMVQQYDEFWEIQFNTWERQQLEEQKKAIHLEQITEEHELARERSIEIMNNYMEYRNQEQAQAEIFKSNDEVVESIPIIEPPTNNVTQSPNDIELLITCIGQTYVKVNQEQPSVLIECR